MLPAHERCGGRSGGPPPVIVALTGIRAVAAGWVLIGHSSIFLFDLIPATRALEPWSSTGFLGVDIFFVLSGFIISYNYAQGFSAFDRRRYGAFLFARFARIYPVHLVTFAAAGLLVAYLAVRGAAPSFAAYTPGQFFGNIFLSQALPGFVAWNASSWSISCEAAAYLVFPVGAAVLLRLRRRHAVVLAVFVLTAQLSVTLALGVAQSSLPPMSWIRITGEFITGCLLWAAWRHGVRGRQRWDVAAGAAVGISIVYLGLVPKGPFSYLVVPLLALLVVSTASASGPVRAFLSSRVMEWGGRVSYSLYLTHFLVLILLIRFVPPRAFDGDSLVVRIAVSALFFIVIIAAAAATYYLVEEPARRWLRRRAPRWEARRSETSPEPMASGAEPAGVVGDGRG